MHKNKEANAFQLTKLSTSRIKEPFLIKHTKYFSLPLPLPILASKGLPVNGISKEKRNQILELNLHSLVNTRRIVSTW